MSIIKNFFAFLVFFCIYSAITDGLFDLGNKWFRWNVNGETKLNFLFFFSLFLSLLTVYRPFRRNFLQRFIVIGNAKQAIIYGLLTGFLLQVFVETTRYIPLLFDRDVVDIGSGQFSAEDNKIAPMAAFLLVSLIGPFNEEFIFRYLLFELIVISVRRFITNSEFSIHSRLSGKYKYTLWTLIILISVAFALMHGPNITNFHFYFIPGLAFTYLYVRYGFLASYLAHVAFNVVGPYVQPFILPYFQPFY